MTYKKTEKRVLGVIPARFDSTRFPGKPLIDLGGKTMIERVYTQAKQAKLLDEVVVATDHAGIMEHVISFGGQAILTSAAHQSGTDRCAEVAATLPEYAHIVNIQGDEPLIQPAQIDLLVERLLLTQWSALGGQISTSIATLVLPLTNAEAIQNPNVVKALINGQEAVYFSRQAIPYVRGVTPNDWPKHAIYYKHIGMYGYTSEALIKIAALPIGQWERAESLEQLRWLEAGLSIGVAITHTETLSIDSPDDVTAVLQVLGAL